MTKMISVTTSHVACRKIPVTVSPLITQLTMTPSKINWLLRLSVLYAKVRDNALPSITRARAF
jgi:hypothetical protein